MRRRKGVFWKSTIVIRASPLLRVKAKITVTNVGCKNPRLEPADFVTVISALTLKRGIALRRSDPTQLAPRQGGHAGHLLSSGHELDFSVHLTMGMTVIRK